MGGGWVEEVISDALITSRLSFRTRLTFLVKGREAPPKPPSALYVHTAPFHADLEAQWAVVLHTSEIVVGGE